MYSLALIMFIMCNHGHHLFPKLSHPPQTETLCLVSNNSPSGPPLVPSNLYVHSVSVKLVILDISYKLNHTVFVLCLWLITLSVFSGFTHVTESIRTSFLFMAK